MRAKGFICILSAAALLAGCADSESSSRKEKKTSASSVTTAAAVTAEPRVTATAAERTEPEFPFDREAVAAAYKSGDRSGLRDYEAAALDAASELIASVVTDDMTLPEKELAVHDKLAAVCQYDEDGLNIFHTHGPHAADPYGALVDGRVICTGYSETFALLMDMLGIECTIVQGTNRSGEEHAWNLVRFEDEWYAVDMTWDDIDDDYEPFYIKHEFFNVPDKVIRDRDHRWNTSEYPRAKGTKYSYSELFGSTVDSLEELEALIIRNGEMGIANVSVTAGNGLGIDLAEAADTSGQEFGKVYRVVVKAGFQIQRIRTDETTRGTALFMTLM